MKRILFNIIFWSFSLCAFGQTFDAILLNQQTDIRIAGAKLIKNHVFSVQINNRAGEKYTEIDIPYSKLTQVGKIEASITDMAGVTIKKLKTSEIKNRSAISHISLYEDNMIKEFTLKHNVYPYILNYSYEESETQFLYIDYWMPVLDPKIPTLKSQLTLTLPINFKIKYTTEKIIGEKKDTIQNNLIYTWSATYGGISDTEIYSPDADTYYPKVKIVPSDFYFEEKGSFDSWKSFGNWQYGINNNLLDLPDAEKARINSLLVGVTDSREKVKTLYHYLQDATRYINVSVETGGMVPYPASYVAENKYGDCKALSNYFLAVLQYAGITSYYTKVRAGDKIKVIDKTFPSQQSNHIILCVPLDRDTIWLDCTSDGPFNYLGTFTQGRAAYIIDKDNSHFVLTPKLKPADVEERRIILGEYKEGTTATVDFKTQMKGSKFDQLSHISREYNKNDQTLIVRNNFIENGFELIGFELLPVHRDSLFINLNYHTQTNMLYQHYGNDFVVRTVPFDLPNFKKPAERKFPVQLDFPICKTDSQVFILPDGYSIPEHVKEDSVQSEYGKYTLKMTVRDQKLMAIKSFVLYDGKCTLEHYPAFYDFIKKVNDKENNALILFNKK